MQQNDSIVNGYTRRALQRSVRPAGRHRRAGELSDPVRDPADDDITGALEHEVP